MKLIRPIVIGVILVNLALMAVAGPIKGTLLRYEVARKQREIRASLRKGSSFGNARSRTKADRRISTAKYR